jgi:hypothetical protein
MYFDKYFQDTILYIIEIKYFINPYGSFFLLRYTTKQLKKKKFKQEEERKEE